MVRGGTERGEKGREKTQREREYLYPTGTCVFIDNAANIGTK